MSYQGIPKIYPNLNPAAAIPVDREQIFRLRSFADNYRMTRGSENGQYVPNARFVFVTMPQGETLLHPRYRHPALSEGKPVLYAGEASFNNGRLEWWSNGSGNYRPDANHAAQAGLPLDQFYSYDDILKGVHKQGGVKQLVTTSARSPIAYGTAQARLAAPRVSTPQHSSPILLSHTARHGPVLVSDNRKLSNVGSKKKPNASPSGEWRIR
jgi:hypothetical protein